MSMDIAPWCDDLLERLPELIWKLPVWPKNYRSHIPWGLFDIKDDWTPSMAIAEVQQKIYQLRQMPSHSSQAQYLSQQILRQVNVLVLLSQKLPSHVEYVFEKKAITRQEHLAELKEQIYILNLQKDALVRNASHSAYTEAMSKEIEKVSNKIMELNHLLEKI